MSSERDLERAIEAWLKPGPTAMPAHLLDAVVARIGRQPQGRLARIQLRISTMRPLVFLAAAAALVIAIGVSYAVFTQSTSREVAAPPSPAVASLAPASAAAPSSAVGAPSPSPSASSSSAPAGAALPSALVHTWFGALRRIPAVDGDTQFVSNLDVSNYGISIQINAGVSTMLSTATVTGSNQLDVTMNGPSTCDAGAHGTYTWNVSPDGRTLTLATVQDDCIARAFAFAGSWTRADCRTPYASCLGAVPAGQYRSMFFDVQSPPGAVAGFGAYGQLRYTLPAGWANADDSPSNFTLVPAADYAGAGGDPNSTAPSHGVLVFARAAPLNQACATGPAPNVAPTASGLATWVASLPTVTATAPVPITVGGHHGMVVDVSLSPSWKGTCPDFQQGQVPIGTLFASERGPTNWEVDVVPNEHLRLVFLDIGAWRPVLVVIDDQISRSSFADLVAQAMPIVESFRFGTCQSFSNGPAKCSQ